MTSADLKEGLMFYSEYSGNVGTIVIRTEKLASISWIKTPENKKIAYIVNMLDDPYEVGVIIKRFKSGDWRELTPLEIELWS
jgi:hypothetical protein